MAEKGWKNKLKQLILSVVNTEYQNRIAVLEENVRNNNDIIKDLEKRLRTVEENVRNNNAEILKLANERDFSIFNAKLEALKNSVGKLQNNVQEEKYYEKDDKKAVRKEQEGTSEASYGKIDYFAFENYFRGDEKIIKQRQRIYLPYFQGGGKVFDLGCGRGEFLEVLQENEVDAIGVDFYDEFSIYCRNKGLNVITGDAISVLKDYTDEVGGIFAGQLVEHLTLEEIVELCEQAYEKLEEGKYLIMETPNPMSLAIYTHAFYMDPSHQKPIHPLTLKYLTEKAGFRDVQILFTEESKLSDEAIPKLQGENISNLDEFNNSMQKVSEYLFGSQDYAIIARK